MSLGIYKGENIDLFGSKGDLTIGLYGINRNQVESNSDVWIYDAYLLLPVEENLSLKVRSLTSEASPRHCKNWCHQYGRGG